MIRTIILDSGPLGLIVHQRLAPLVVDCRAWIERHLKAGVGVIVPAIVGYELRRELLRLGHTRSLALLDAFMSAEPSRYLPLTDSHLRHAAQLWADLRRQGRSTADPHAIDVDVILAAQVLSLGLRPFTLMYSRIRPMPYFPSGGQSDKRGAVVTSRQLPPPACLARA